MRSACSDGGKNPKKGASVIWKWAGEIAEGEVIEVNTYRTEMISKGKHIVRSGSSENLAVIILHKNGSEFLKLVSELLD